MGRALGIDLGKVRIGLAVGEGEVGVATPLKALQAVGTLAKDADQVARAAVEHGAKVCVLGLPLVDGEESKMAGVVRRFGTLLVERGLMVEYVDETMTSREADEALFEAGLKSSERKRLIDSEAAARILERYWGL